jgi:prepilin-type N-terminal cleavage/methylation domain-containing protein
MVNLRSKRPGFTLVELVIVIAVIAVITAAVFIAIDPAKRLHAARNSRRWSDTAAILGAIKTYQADNSGSLPGSTLSGLNAANAYIIGTGVTCTDYSCPGVATGLTVPASGCDVDDLDSPLGPFLQSMPYDPSGSAADSMYWINKNANGLITVGACNPEGEGTGGGSPVPSIKVGG